MPCVVQPRVGSSQRQRKIKRDRDCPACPHYNFLQRPVARRIAQRFRATFGLGCSRGAEGLQFFRWLNPRMREITSRQSGNLSSKSPRDRSGACPAALNGTGVVVSRASGALAESERVPNPDHSVRQPHILSGFEFCDEMDPRRPLNLELTASKKNIQVAPFCIL